MISVDKVGRVVLPKAIRDKAGAQKFAVSWNGKVVSLEPIIEQPSRLIRVKGRLVLAATGETTNAVRAVRELRTRHG